MTARDYAIEMLVSYLGGSKPLTLDELSDWVADNAGQGIDIKPAEIQVIRLACLVLSEPG